MKRKPSRENLPLHGLATAEISKGLENTQVGKFHTKGGVGFAAEEANALADKLRGRRVKMSGLSNARNGADRVAAGVAIQTKYFAAAKDTLQSAFDASTGLYRYPDQTLEVPRDQYDECLALLRTKISAGKVPRFINPDDAENILKRGSVTYRQARNVARAGNVDSLAYDATSQAITSSYVFAISLTVDFAQRRWSGQKSRAALRDALTAALASGSKSAVTGVVAAQLLRSQAARSGTILVRNGLRGFSRTSFGKTTIEQIAAGSLGKSVYGAAALNRVSKLLRSNALTSTVTMVVVTTPDFYRAAIAHNISWGQFTKNLLVNIAGLAVGVGGWMAGVGLGAAVGSAVPVLGTAVGGVAGGLIGALAGGFGGSKAAKLGLDQWIKDDAKKMLSLVQRAAEDVAHDYLLLETEIPALVDHVKTMVTPAWLRRMYQAGIAARDEHQAYEFACDAFEGCCRALLEKRPRIFCRPRRRSRGKSTHSSRKFPCRRPPPPDHGGLPSRLAQARPGWPARSLTGSRCA